MVVKEKQVVVDECTCFMYIGIDILIGMLPGLCPLTPAEASVSAESDPVIDAFGDVIRHGGGCMSAKFTYHVAGECLTAVFD